MMVDITYISGKWDDQWDLHPLNSQLNPEHHQFSVGFTHLPSPIWQSRHVFFCGGWSWGYPNLPGWFIS